MSGDTRMFAELVRVFEEAGLPYCMLAGYDGYPDSIPSDIDFMVAPRDAARLPQIIGSVAARCGSHLIQCIRHETTAAYFVLARVDGAALAYLHPDSSGDYRRRGRFWLKAEDVLARRRRHPQGFWVPAAADAFAYYLIKKIDKGRIEPLQAAELSARWREDPLGARHAVSALLPEREAGMIEDAATSGDWTAVTAALATLRATLHAHATAGSFGERIAQSLAEVRRIAGRIAHPTGMSLVFLGPDGSGKSSVIERVSAQLAPAFRHVRYQHLRPGVLSRRRGGYAVVTEPHAKPARGRLGSGLKLVHFWADYVVGGVCWLFPLRVRSTLVIFDRYYHDLLADPRRYRYGAPLSWVRALGRFVPQPDLAFVLDAPPDVVLSRKQEVPRAEAARQRMAYLRVAHEFRNARIIDAALPLDQVVAAVLRHVVDHLEAGATERLGIVPVVQVAPR